MKCEHYEDPVAAYDRLAPAYAKYSKKRELYLRSVERLIAERAGQARSLLDIGAGDGTRAARLASAIGIERLVLLEPSSGMSARIKHAELWRMRAEDLRPETITPRFDAITCLWNVLGHISDQKVRERVLRTSEQLLSPTGRIFMDVNHRYNAASYGWAATCGRWLRDAVSRDPRNGDVTAKWKVGEARISTYGHVFTHREVLALADAAGLEIEQHIVVDYEDGSVRRLPWFGNLLYVLCRNSRIESSSASATS